MPAKTLEAVTTCQKAIPSMVGSKSLRATIPAIVVSILELKPGDKLRWSIDTASGRLEVSKEARKTPDGVRV
jgi:hypothetical protein